MGSGSGPSRRHRIRQRIRSLMSSTRSPWSIPVVVFIALVLIATGAILLNTINRQQVQVDDGSVWITSQDERKVARFKPGIGEADVALSTNTSRFDLAQSGYTTILGQDGAMSPINASTASIGDRTRLGTQVEQIVNGPTVALHQRTTGKVWVGRGDDLKSLDPNQQQPILTLGRGGAVSVTPQGSVYAFRPSDGAVLVVDGPGGKTHRTLESITDGKPIKADGMAVVGDQAVVLSGRTLYWSKGSTRIHSSGDLTIQETPVDRIQRNDWVGVSDQGGVHLVNLDAPGTDPTLITTGGSGQPARPVSSGGCLWAAWSSPSRNFIRLCGTGGAMPSAQAEGRKSDPDPRLTTLQSISPTDNLVFRANHRQVILNDVLAGNVWNPRESTKMIKVQWRTMEVKETQTRDQKEDSANNQQRFAPSCDSRSGAIKAEDDQFGIRAGTQALLDPLRNDHQTDCSVLQISDAQTSSGEVTLAPVYDGRFLQVDAGRANPGTVRINYSITDGHGQVSSAGIVLTIAPENMIEENRAPEQVDTPPEYEVEQGATISINALAGFMDPDGDTMTLVAAAPTNSDQVSVSTRTDGRLTLSTGSATSGRVGIRVTVSDGRQSGDGLVYFSIRPANTLSPLVDPVIRQVQPGRTVRINLKETTHGNSAQPLRLAKISQPDETRVESNTEDLSFTFSAQNPGTYYVPYTVAQGDHTTQGLARLEVAQIKGEAAKPVAVNDVALLGADQTAIVDPLDNDLDPMGGVLALTSVSADPSSGIKAGIVNHKRIYLTARQIPSHPVNITYTVANSAGDAQGTITLQPPPLDRGSSTPKADNISAQVRQGGLVTVRVMDHVTYPDGTTVSLEPDLGRDQGTFKGLVFVSGDVVRYQAGQEPGTYPVTYTVKDNLGNTASGVITFEVHTGNQKDKPAPTPDDVQAQVAAGSKVRIPVALTGIDPDGDCDTLSGLGNQAPKLGRITQVGADYLIYEAYADSSGTDDFTYAVEDWVGQRAQGHIRVGVFRNSTGGGVFSRDDQVTMRPGMAVDVPVLSNDISGDDTPLTLDPHLEATGVSEAKVVDNMIRLTTPPQAGTAYVVYRARNQAGISDQATLTITTDPKAPIQPPTLQDYDVAPADTIDKRTVEVDLADSMSNPSGTVEDLKLEVHPSAGDHARVKGGPGSTVLSIDLTDQARAVPYTVTNTRYGITSTAFVKVPAFGVFPPTIRPKAPDLRVRAGQSITIDIADHVRVGAGKTARIASPDSVSATKSDGSDPYVDPTTLRFTADRDYSGPASLTFTAQDGVPDGKTIVNSAVLTLPITVEGGREEPPTLSAPPIDLVAGDPAQTISLKALTRIPRGSASDSYTYSTSGASGPIQVSLTPQGQLAVSADKTAAPGARATLPVTIAYKDGTVKGGLTFRVVKTTRPLASIPSRTVRAKAGQSLNVDVLDGAMNPFPDTPLRVVGVVTDDTSKLTASHSGDGQVTIKTDRDIGASTNIVLVTVEDGTRDKDRRVSASITVSIVDRPQAPKMLAGSPRAGDGTVSLAWLPGSANGSPIDEYRVSYRSSTGSGQQSCSQATTCTISGLSNGQDYSFTVQAHNEVGWSPASSPLAARPDVIPGGVRNLSMDGNTKETLTVRWDQPENRGSAIDRYLIQTTGSGCGSMRGRSPTSTSAVFSVDHQDAGQACSITVTPSNLAGAGEARSVSGSTWSHPDPPAFGKIEQPDPTNNPGLIDLALIPGADHGRPCGDILVTIEGADPSDDSWTLGCTSGMATGQITLPASMARPGNTIRFKATSRIGGMGEEGQSPATTRELTLVGTRPPKKRAMESRRAQATREAEHGPSEPRNRGKPQANATSRSYERTRIDRHE